MEIQQTGNSMQEPLSAASAAKEALLTSPNLEKIEEESNQSFDEDELLDQDGNFVIFAPETQD